MALALEKILNPGSNRPDLQQVGTDRRLNIAVIFTSQSATLQALRKAGELASQLNAKVTLLVPQVVPYPLPLESPPVPLSWNERKFSLLASNSPVETRVHIYLCRERNQALLSALVPRSLVVVGCGRSRWWKPAPERRLARQIRKAGHEVVIVETE